MERAFWFSKKYWRKDFFPYYKANRKKARQDSGHDWNLIFETLNNNEKCLNIITIARSAQRNNLAKKLYKIKCPTFLIWGLNDTITPPSVAHQFNKMIPKSKLKFIDRCCHAPMMERPKKFNSILKSFLDEN